MLSRRNVIAGGAMAAAIPASVQSSGRLVAKDGVVKAVADAISAHACPGVSVAIAQAGVIRFSQGFGTANMETRSPVTQRSVFRIGSLTKQFTAAAIIKLASLGRLDVHAPANTYLPSLKAVQPFTLLELMNHTAGLRSDEGGDCRQSCSMPPKTQIELAGDITRQPKPFDFEPGTAWLYSNANYIVLGAIIESVTGLRFDRAISELVLMPLGLTSLALDAPSEIVTGRVAGYSVVEGNAPSFENAAYLDVSQAGGAGAMRGNAVDLCRWHDALLGYRLFDSAHFDLMLSPGRLRNGRLSGTNRFSVDDAHYGDVEYGCGLLISGPSDPNASILHYGSINGFAALLQTYLCSRTTFVVLCNCDTGPALPFRGIRKAVLAQYLF